MPLYNTMVWYVISVLCIQVCMQTIIFGDSLISLHDYNVIPCTWWGPQCHLCSDPQFWRWNHNIFKLWLKQLKMGYNGTLKPLQCQQKKCSEWMLINRAWTTFSRDRFHLNSSMYLPTVRHYITSLFGGILKQLWVFQNTRLTTVRRAQWVAAKLPAD